MSNMSGDRCLVRNAQLQVLCDSSKTALFFAVAVAAVCFVGAAWVFAVTAPEPYMDEVFHVPQTQAYCEGKYGHWDPKITTLPGLYMFAVAYARLVSVGQKLLAAFGAIDEVPGSWQECGETRLRQVNWVLSLGTLCVMRALLGRHMAPHKASVHALLLWLYPVSFFFSFLLYTDMGGTFFFLLCYLLATAHPGSSSWARRLGSAMATRGIASRLKSYHGLHIILTMTSESPAMGLNCRGFGDMNFRAAFISIGPFTYVMITAGALPGLRQAGGVSIFFRQTNAVWVAFTLAVCLVEEFLPLVNHRTSHQVIQGSPRPNATGARQDEPDTKLEGPTPVTSGKTTESSIAVNDGDDTSVSSSSVTSSLRKRRPSDSQASLAAGQHSAKRPIRPVHISVQEQSAKARRVCCRTEPHKAPASFGGWAGNVDELGPPLSLSRVPVILMRLVQEALIDAYHGGPLLRRHIPLSVPVFVFAAFVWGFNGGSIAVGDKENHHPGGPPHLAQLGYLVAVGASLWGFIGEEAICGRRARNGFISWVKNRGLLSCAGLFCAVGYGLWRYSLAHPFLLSDNRHFPFYVWRRLLRHPALRAALSPIYVFCGWLLVSRLHARKGALWAITYVAAAAVVLVPSPLLEPRYLTVPVLLAHLESGERSWCSILAGIVACAAVNAATIYLFLFRPFAWHDASMARFMW